MLSLLQANEVLLAGRKLTAVEACNYGFVTEVFPQAEFQKEVDKRMKHLASLPPKVTIPMFVLFMLSLFFFDLRCMRKNIDIV